MKALVLLALAAAVVALALVPGRLGTHRAVETSTRPEPTHHRALSLEDMERLRRARRALIDAERAGGRIAGPLTPIGHGPSQ